VTTHPKDNLKLYLRDGRETLVWKLHGLSEHDIRRPLVPTGTNLLGLIKHAARVEFVYFGETFGRPASESSRWFVGLEPNADMWAAADESREAIVELYEQAWVHSDATIDGLALDAIGRVPHWPAGQSEVTLHQILVHVIVDTQRHAGHADIIRELIDGTVGLLEGAPNVPNEDQGWWARRHDMLQRIAEESALD
jgi:Protein of unknown function (DUF664)